MKIRNGFVSNSSSSSFVIINKLRRDLSWVEFIVENESLVRKLMSEKTDHYMNEHIENIEHFFLDLLEVASEMNILKPGKNKITLFNDGGDPFGDIFSDYFNEEISKLKTISWGIDYEHEYWYLSQHC